MCIFYSCDIYTKFLLLFDKKKIKKRKAMKKEKISKRIKKEVAVDAYA